MDRLRPILAAIQKYQFWGLSVLVAVVSLVCWWLATSGLAGLYQKRKSQLDSAFNSARIQPDHPNQKVIDEIKNQNEQLSKNVFSAWESLYSKQKEQNPFPAVLSEEFRKRFEELKPKDTLARPYLELYQNFIKQHLPSLRTKISARHPKDGQAAKKEAAGMGGMGGGGVPGGRGNQDDADMVGVVDWSDTDYSKLVQRFEWQATPSTLDVVLAQEDLWVYEALLRAIANANEGAATPAEATVKRIDNLQLGKDSQIAWNNAESAVFSARSTAAPAQENASPNYMGRRMMGAESASEEQSRRLLMDNRYVDDKGHFLPYDAEYPYAKHPYAEFKMMPISMDLVMDQRKLPKFLAECANSNMPIEVRRVRLLKTQGESIDMGGAGGGGGGAVMGGAGGGTPGAAKSTESGTMGMPVQIQAVIYIYNPPDREKLGTGTASEQKSSAGH